jgi:hypothetical protein
MDKILVQLLGTTFGRSFIAGVFIAMSTAIAALSAHAIGQTKVIQNLNDRLIETERKHKEDSDARWRADIERSNGLLRKIQEATKSMKRR